MRNALFVWTALFYLAGCQPDVGTAQQPARVEPDQAQRAFAIVADIDYLPFNYKADGCYARALYMSMELAAQGIPSSAQYVYGWLWATWTTLWGYHVAPMIQVGDQEPWVLDPAFQEEPLPLKRWIRKTWPLFNSYSTYYDAGSKYLSGAGFNPGHSPPMIESFEELPRFKIGDISHACSTMYRYLELEGLDVEGKRQKLVTRTHQLLDTLIQRDKLEEGGYWHGFGGECQLPASL